MFRSRSFARAVNRLLAGATDIREGERRAVLAAAGLFFLVLAVVMVLRPVREATGLESGIENVRWLFLGKLGGIVVLVPAVAQSRLASNGASRRDSGDSAPQPEDESHGA